MAKAGDLWLSAMRKAGGADRLAQTLGVKRRTIFLWRRNGVPADRLASVAEITGIPAAQLRPDLAKAFGVAA